MVLSIRIAASSIAASSADGLGAAVFQMGVELENQFRNSTKVLGATKPKFGFPLGLIMMFFTLRARMNDGQMSTATRVTLPL